MITALKSSIFKIIDLFENHSDPRTKQWFMISSILIPLTILLLYFWICNYLGPSLMKQRPPMEVGRFLNLYNLFMLSFNGALTIFFIYYQIKLKYSPVCQAVNTKGESELMLARGYYAFYISKICELTDTLMIIMRKKANQMTFLHQYHHSSMVMIVWTGVRFVPGGSTTLIATVNTGTHFVVYAYYYLSLYELRILNVISFRNVTTFSQLIQFCLVILHCITAYFKDCGYPRSSLVCVLLYVASFEGLFIWFICLNQMCNTSTIAVQTRNGGTSNPPAPPPTENQSLNWIPSPGTFPSKIVQNHSNEHDASDSLTAESKGGFANNVNKTEVKMQAASNDINIDFVAENLENEGSTLPPFMNDQRILKKHEESRERDKSFVLLRKTSPKTNLKYRPSTVASTKSRLALTRKMSVLGSLMEINRVLNLGKQND